MTRTGRRSSSSNTTRGAKLLSPFPEPGREYAVRLDLVRVDESPAAAFLLPDSGEGGPK